MAPTAHIIVYYVQTDGEVIADSLDVELTGILQNFVSYRGFFKTPVYYIREYMVDSIKFCDVQVDLKVTPGEVMPGESVNLVLSAKPNSFIGLLGIDQRSILLKSGNDISYVRKTL